MPGLAVYLVCHCNDPLSPSQKHTSIQGSIAFFTKSGCMSSAQASTQKVAALTRASQAETTAEQAFREVGDMRDQLADLRERLNQVPAPPPPPA